MNAVRCLFYAFIGVTVGLWAAGFWWNPQYEYLMGAQITVTVPLLLFLVGLFEGVLLLCRAVRMAWKGEILK
uniref:Uncharacterized protein n=1 Tax=viral metagenome TaxID=1070528 RepID=A0A6M3LBE5_9ZZZZ